jgi:UDP-glucose 4-epimerase
MTSKIFITGGAGYIGSHTCVELLSQNYEVMVFDNLSNGSKEAIKRVELLTNKNLKFCFGDIRDEKHLKNMFNKYQPDKVIHFAGLKAVGESVSDPLAYYDVNVRGSINILNAMSEIGCRNIIFSSSASVYDNQLSTPYCETDRINPISPYGRTKLAFEMVLKDWANSNIEHRAIALRYFNPVGAHHSGLIGEDPKGAPNNLMPFIAQVASGKRNYLPVFGDNYLTRDGTGERDYIHVVDLAIGHVKSVQKISDLDQFQIINLGTGESTTVLELVKSFEQINNVKIPIRIESHRSGDVSKSLADVAKSLTLLNFKCARTLEDMCADTWYWQSKNPNGYVD